MKTEFKLEFGDGDKAAKSYGTINIIGKEPNDSPYVAVYVGRENGTSITGWVCDADAERLAVNILRSLNSKRLRTK